MDTITDTGMETFADTYEIPGHRLDELHKKLAHISRRAIKLGMPPITVAETGRRIERRTVPGTRAIQLIEWVSVVIVGEPPHLDGWQFLATLEDGGEAGNLISAVPGAVIPKEYRECDATTCDHCHLKRRRTQTYILRHEDGQYAQVGSNCLLDFFGGLDPHATALYCQALAAARSLCGAGWDDGTGEDGYLLDEFLAHVAAQVSRAGWLSRGKAYEQNRMYDATANIAGENLYELQKHNMIPGTYYTSTGHAYEVWKPTDADVQSAADALNAVRADLDARYERDDLNDYQHNLRVILSHETVAYKGFGLAASAIPYALRLTSQAVERQAQAQRINGYFGIVSKRGTFTLTVVGCYPLETLYGQKTRVVMRDAEGRAAIWWATGSHSYQSGATYRVAGTVTKHEEYNGTKQTTLSRCNLTRI